MATLRLRSVPPVLMRLSVTGALVLRRGIADAADPSDESATRAGACHGGSVRAIGDEDFGANPRHPTQRARGPPPTRRGPLPSMIRRMGFKM